MAHPVSVLTESAASYLCYSMLTCTRSIASTHSFRYVLKDRMDLAEAWIGPSPATPFKGFTVGAPHCRARHVLTTPPEANMNCQQWHDKIARTMAEAKAKAGKQGAPRNCNVYPFIPEKSKAAQANSSLPTFLPIEIAIMDTMATVIRKVLEQLAVADPKPDNYSIYEISEYGLQKCASFASPLALLTAGGRASIHRSRCHFVVRPAQATPLRVDMLPPNVQSLVVHSSPKKGSPGKKSGKWSDWGKSAKAMLPKKIFGGGGGGGGSDGKRKGPVGTAVLPKYKAPANAAGPRGASSGCLYGKVLADVMVDGELPLPVQNMLVRLYQDGPMAKGLFRVSANAKLLRQVKERLDTGQEVDMVEVPILAVGATLKEYVIQQIKLARTHFLSFFLILFFRVTSGEETDRGFTDPLSFMEGGRCTPACVPSNPQQATLCQFIC